MCGDLRTDGSIRIAHLLHRSKNFRHKVSKRLSKFLVQFVKASARALLLPRCENESVQRVQELSKPNNQLRITVITGLMRSRRMRNSQEAQDAVRVRIEYLEDMMYYRNYS